MNYINFDQIGGFPLSTNIFKLLQNAFTIFNSLGQNAGNKTIISGCVLVGSTVSDGVVYVNGECLEFRGGILQSNVILVEETSSLLFENNNMYPVIKTRYITFGTGDEQMNWADFKRVDPIITLMARLTSLEKKTSVFQAGGGMVLWNKPAAQIPEGWAEVVNWRGRIPVGMDVLQTEFNTLGKTGGNKNKTLSISEMPSHTHDFTLQGNGGGSNGITYNDGISNSKSYTTESKGNGAQFSILNPYRTVLFIEFIG